MGQYVLEHGVQRVVNDMQEVAKAPSVSEMQRKVMAMCERMLGSSEFARLKREMMDVAMVDAAMVEDF